MGIGPAFPRRFEILREEWVLTPQLSLRLSIQINGTLNFYLLEVSSSTIFAWINEHRSDPIDFGNVTNLEGLVKAHPEWIGLQSEIHAGKTEYEYVPTKVTNTTLVISNPSSDYIYVEYEGSIIGQVAPTSKVRILSQWVIPIGFVLTLPYLINLWRSKKRLQSPQL